MKASQTTLYPFTFLLPPQHISLPNVSYVVCSRYCLPRLLSVSPAREKVPLEQEALPGLFLLHSPNLAQDLVQDEQLMQHLTNFVFSLSSGLMSHHSNITISSNLAIGPFFQDLKHVIFLQTWKPLQILFLLPRYLLTLFSFPSGLSFNVTDSDNDFSYPIYHTSVIVSHFFALFSQLFITSWMPVFPTRL